MKKIYLTLLGCILFGFELQAQCDDLIISEYIEGSSNNKALEIYNPTDQTIDLSTYKVFLINNGGSANDVDFDMVGTLAPYSVYVIANNAADASILAVADTAMPYNSVAHFNGDDAVGIVHGTDTIDAIGNRYDDPGSSWPVDTGATKEFTLVRKASVKMGQLNWTLGASEWMVHPQNTFSNLGTHSSYCAYRKTNVAGARTADGDLNITNKGENVEVTGIVYGIDLDGNAGISFTIIDSSAGINIFNFVDVSDYVVKEGDEILVRGELDFYNGLTEVKADSIVVITNSNPLKTPMDVETPSEATESQYIKISGIWIADTITVWPSGNISMTNSNKDTFLLRIDSDVTEIVGTSIMYDTMNITGIGGQFVRFAPYDEGYQIFAHFLADIEDGGDLSSVKDIELISNIYPNPTTGKISVQTLQPVSQITITDINGQVVFKQGNFSASNFTVNLTNLSKGVYFIHVGDASITAVEKIILD
jgi:Secretion system C-terminal sorting domain/Lamin Tail Domain